MATPIRMGGTTNRMGGATSFPYPALPSQLKSLLNASRSFTMHTKSLPLTAGGTLLKESDDLDILRVIFDSRMTSEKHLRSISRAASERLGIFWKSWRVFHDIWAVLGKCFLDFVLSVSEYCLYTGYCFRPWVAAQAVRWPSIPKVARSRLTECSKSCDLQPALHCAIHGAQGLLPCVGCGRVRPV